MYYYKVLDKKIFKYEVSYDLEKVKSLQNDLVNDCCIEKEYLYSSVGVPHREKGIIYKKFDYKFIGTRYDFYGDDDIYEVNTIELITPSLYNLINEILNGNVLALEKLFAKKIELKENSAKDIDYYQASFQRLFNVTLVDTMDLEMYERLLDFVDFPKPNNKKEYSLVLNRGKKTNNN